MPLGTGQAQGCAPLGIAPAHAGAFCQERANLVGRPRPCRALERAIVAVTMIAVAPVAPRGAEGATIVLLLLWASLAQGTVVVLVRAAATATVHRR